MYPIWVGFESRSARKPSFAIPATIMIVPTSSAIIDASAIARSGSPFEPRIGSRVAAIIGPSDESGPRTSTRDGPKTA